MTRLRITFRSGFLLTVLMSAAFAVMACVNPPSTPTPFPTQLQTDTPTAVPSATPAPIPTDTPTSSPTVPPTATPLPTPTPTQIPTSTPVPSPTPIPSPTPVPSVCANGSVIEEPGENLGLIADCEALLAAKDILVADRSLNWSVDLPIQDWDGIEVSGSPKRVTALLRSPRVQAR